MKKLIKKINSLFEDKKKRYLYLCIFVLPFLIAIGIFCFVSYKEAKNILSLIMTTETRDEYQIKSQNYLLRDNATDLQIELFAELKDMIEGETAPSPEQLAECVCKNYVADFYTWSNKAGQYDVGGMYYVFTPQKQNIYIKSRADFYKYINEYINKYKMENLLEVETINAVSSKCDDIPYVAKISDEESFEYYDVYLVKCTWTYKNKETFNTSRYCTKMNFIVVDNNGRYEIVEAYE